MKRISFVFGCLLSAALHAQTSQSFLDNTDVPIVLSDSNYNRLVVRGDKITQAHFPESAMGIKNEEDGSLYVVVSQKEPFTLFLATENGHHFSTTVSTESSLGRTIEFVPQVLATIKKSNAVMAQTSKPLDANLIQSLMVHLVQKTPMLGFEIKHHYSRSIRLPSGLVLLPRLIYTGKTLNGEVTEIYNRGKTPIDLVENLFMSQGVKAVSLSQATILPKQKAYLYRVMENHHG